MILDIPARMPLTLSLGKGIWEVREPWAFTIILDTQVPWTVHKCVVPVGFVTDLYSVPVPLSWFIPRDETDNRPCIVHDWLYATGGLRATAKDDFSPLNRYHSDLALAVACRLCDLKPKRRQWSIPTGVRLGGFKAWNNCLAQGASLETPLMGHTR